MYTPQACCWNCWIPQKQQLTRCSARETSKLSPLLHEIRRCVVSSLRCLARSAPRYPRGFARVVCYLPVRTTSTFLHCNIKIPHPATADARFRPRRSLLKRRSLLTTTRPASRATHSSPGMPAMHLRRASRAAHLCVHILGSQTPSPTSQIDERCSITRPRTTARSRPTRARTRRRRGSPR